MRSAPIPLIELLNSEAVTFRRVVVPRGGMFSAVTACAVTFELELVIPVGKNCTKAFADDADVPSPSAELLKMLMSVWKLDPFAPWAEPTTDRNTSLLAASTPVGTAIRESEG